MSTRIHPMFVLLVGIGLLGACKNDQHCPGNLNDDCRLGDAPTPCSSSAQCDDPTPACDTSTMTCVQCTPAEVGACTGATPVCRDTTCESCTRHLDCPASDVCLPDGSCVDPALDQVAYVTQGGSGTTCMKAMPCATLDAAVLTGKPYIKIAAGQVKDNKITMISGRAVTVLADFGAKLDRDGDGPILDIHSANTDVRIFDLEITGATDPGGDAILLQPNGGSPMLTLTRVLVNGNQGRGIVGSGGSLVVAQSIFSSNAGGGIVMTASGIISITNSYIHHNGTPVMASVGGLSLRPTGTSKVEFNTIIDNQANLGAASSGGMFCDVAGFIAANNIIFRNTGGAAGNVQTFGNCTYGNSFVMPGATPADNSLNFASPNAQPYDYHLTTTSPSSVVGAAGACTGIDFDGDARPARGTCDLGADELAP